MGSNRNIRIGVALMGGAFLLLVAFLVWKFSRGPAQPTVVDANPTSGATPIAMRSDRLSAVALVDLPARSIITASDFRMEELPEGMTTAGLVTDPDSQGIGFITNRPIRRNDRIRTNYLAGHISEVGIAGALQPGTRAMMFPIPTKSTLHDLVRVGDFVDVIASFDQQESRTIVENVRVLAVDVFMKDYPVTSAAVRGPFKAPGRAGRSGGASPPQATSGQPATPATQPQNGAAPTPTPTPTPTATPQPAPVAPALTLEVTPDQANRISLAANSGAAIDLLSVRRAPMPVLVPGATPGVVRAVSVNRAQLAPYAESKKASSGSKSASASRSANRSSGSGRDYPSDSGFSGPLIPVPETGSTGLVPLPVDGATTPKETYDIPIYADGTRVRVDTVLKPN